MTSERTISGYKLLHLLGRGNTSLAHLAQDSQGRQVALKIPLEETLRSQEAAERFGNEVRLTLQCRHPHVIHAYAGTPFGPKAFLALQYYPEGALVDVLEQRGQLPLEQALRILADVASSLTYLHGLGAVHQDVKPHNVYLAQGRAALGDLGSAYFMAQGGPVSGSPFYMAPEIYHGGSSSAASDVYSLGVLTYELLTGKRPLYGHTYEELMGAHLTYFPPPLSHLNPQVPRSVARLAEKALAKRAQDRPEADMLRRALLTALGEPTDEEEPVQQTLLPDALARQVGRHGPSGTTSTGTLLPENTAKPEPRGVARWNPFKRRK